MSKEETTSEQPAKRRKVDNSSNDEENLQHETGVQSIESVRTECSPKTAEDSIDAVKDTNEESSSQEKFHNFVTDEEVDKLRQFHVLDEVKSNDEVSNDENSDDSDGIWVF